MKIATLQAAPLTCLKLLPAGSGHSSHQDRGIDLSARPDVVTSTSLASSKHRHTPEPLPVVRTTLLCQSVYFVSALDTPTVNLGA